jgi:membrane carboxypeptidase/penicillin-binding protein
MADEALERREAHHPLVHYALAKQRQRHVLHQLVVNHYLAAAQADAAYAEPLNFT